MKRLSILAAVLCLLTTAGCGRFDPGMDVSENSTDLIAETSDSDVQDDSICDETDPAEESTDEADVSETTEPSSDEETGFLEDDPRFIELSDDMVIYKIYHTHKDSSGNIISESVSESNKYGKSLSYTSKDLDADEEYKATDSYVYDENHRVIRSIFETSSYKYEWVYERDNDGKVIHQEMYEDGQKRADFYPEYNDHGDEIKCRSVHYSYFDDDAEPTEYIDYHDIEYDDNGNIIHKTDRDGDGNIEYEMECTYDKDNHCLTASHKSYNEEKIVLSSTSRYEYDPETGREIFCESSGTDGYTNTDFHEERRHIYSEDDMSLRIETTDLVKNETTVDEYVMEYVVSDELAEMFETKKRKKDASSNDGSEEAGDDILAEYAE